MDNLNDVVDILEQLFDIWDSFGTVASVIRLAVAVLTIVSMWIVFTKAGEGGWKILIPFYNEYIRFKIAHCAGRFWTTLVLSIGGSGCLIYGFVRLIAGMSDQTAGNAVPFLILGAVLLLVCGIIRATVHFKMAGAFNLPGVFGLGLWLLPTIFYAILAFNKNILYGQPETIYPSL